MARSVASLGVDRGIRAFGRYAILKGRGAAGDKNAPRGFGSALRRIDSAIFDFSKHGGAALFQRIVVALGAAERDLANAERLREAKKLRPLAALSAPWIEAASDTSPEFSVALALASLHDPEGKIGPLRANLEPVDWKKRRRSWAEKDRSVVWNAADLATNLAGVLQRRVMDGARAGCKRLPLASRYTVPPDTVAAFLAGDLDEERIERLIRGLMLVDIPRKPIRDLELKGLPYIRVRATSGGGALTNSVLEAHRINSPYILEGGDKSVFDMLKRDAAGMEKGPAVLPLVTETLPVAEATRRRLMGIFGRQNPTADGGRGRSPVFSGKDEHANTLSGHTHAYYLPTDEDGDGRLDHLTVFAQAGFGRSEIRALDALRKIETGRKGEDRHELRLLLLGLGTREDYAPGPLRPSRVWVSATPYLATRYAKTRGKDRIDLRSPEDRAAFLREDLRSQLRAVRAELAAETVEAAMIEPLQDGNDVFRLPCGRRPIEFRRYRRKAGDDGGRRLAGAFRLTFPREVPGPIALGWSSHFGLGLFVPERTADGAT